LDFGPTTINPLGIVGHAIDIRECLYSHFNFAGVVKDTARTVHVVGHGLQAKVSSGIPENSVVPAFEIWVTLDQTRKSLPLVSGGDESGTVRANGEYSGIAGLEGVLRPRIVGNACNKGRGGESCSVGLSFM
jgi:hypothetical protein